MSTRICLLALLAAIAMGCHKPGREIASPNPYYMFRFLVTPSEGDALMTNSIGDIITIYDRGDTKFYPVLWLYTESEYPAIYEIAYQGQMWFDDGWAITNYRLKDLDAHEYDRDILGARYVRSVASSAGDRTDTVTARDDPLLWDIMRSSYIDLYRANLLQSTRITTNEADSVSVWLMEAKLK